MRTGVPSRPALARRVCYNVRGMHARRPTNGSGRRRALKRVEWEFLHEPIEVEFAKKPGPPTAFVWRGERHEVAEVLRGWADHGFGPMKYPGKWWQRRHRNCYRVRTTHGIVVEFYLDRGRSAWVLTRRWRSDPEPRPHD